MDNENVGLYLLLLGMWVFLGGITGWVGESLGYLPTNVTAAETAAVVIFWPVFVIKWLALGLWAVLLAFFSLIG